MCPHVKSTEPCIIIFTLSLPAAIHDPLIPWRMLTEQNIPWTDRKFRNSVATTSLYIVVYMLTIIVRADVVGVETAGGI
jgi:hypothetical protein